METISKGDAVCVFEGGRVPCILRPFLYFIRNG
jgi:hypothetical protein